MAETYNTPFDENRAAFNLLIGEIAEQIEDPYITAIHERVRYYEQSVVGTCANDHMVSWQTIIADLDAHWQYHGLSIEISGDAWVQLPDAEFEKRHLTLETVTSKGFKLISYATDASMTHDPKIAYIFELIDPAYDKPLIGTMTLGDLQQIELPVPSPEKRERRFEYHFPEQATWIDELAFTSSRQDKIIQSFAEFYIDVNLDDPYEIEHIQDATVYMKRRAEIEPVANYHLTVLGDIIFVNEDGDGIPVHLSKPLTRTVSIKDLAIRPADIRVDTIKGRHRCVPYIEVELFHPDETNQGALIPCASLMWMSSVRYMKPSY